MSDEFGHLDGNAQVQSIGRGGLAQRSSKEIKQKLLEPHFKSLNAGPMIAKILERVRSAREMPEHHKGILDRLHLDEAFGEVSRSVRMLNAMAELKHMRFPERPAMRYTDMPDLATKPYAFN